MTGVRNSPISRIARLLLAPLELAGLLTLIVLSLALTVASKTGAFGVPLILILLSWFFKYSFALLDSLSRGQSQPPVLSVEMIMSDVGEFRWLVPLMIVLVAFFVSDASTWLLGTSASILAGMLLVAWFPVVLVIQGWSGRLSYSLNPCAWKAVIHSLGRDYWANVAATASIVVVCIVVPASIDSLPLLIRIGLLLYSWLAMIALTGGTLFDRREDLDEVLPQIVPQLQADSQTSLLAERDHWADEIYAAWRGNAVGKAHRIVMQRVESSGEPLPELQWLLERMAQWDPPQLTDAVACELVTRLLREDQEGAALRLVKERRSIHPHFVPSRVDDRQRLAQIAARWGDRSTAEELLNVASDFASVSSKLPRQ